jgi:hypothetical protein
MANGITEKITAKVTVLPPELQREALDFIEFLEQKLRKKKPFKSVEGILNADLSNLDEDLKEIRAEMWKNFPREFPDVEEQK